MRFTQSSSTAWVLHVLDIEPLKNEQSFTPSKQKSTALPHTPRKMDADLWHRAQLQAQEVVNHYGRRR